MSRADDNKAVVGRNAPKAFAFRSLGTMAAFGHTRAACDVRGFELTGFVAWWMRRTYSLSQMPGWATRVRIALDWTVSLFFRPDLTKVDLAREGEQELRNFPAGSRSISASGHPSAAMPIATAASQAHGGRDRS